MYCDAGLCTGCKACELACSAFHERVFNPHKSRIHVVWEEPGVYVAITCRQCANPPCVLACPFRAIRKSPEGLVEVDVEHCRGCGFCVEACPFGAITVANGTAVKCDLCGGKPACVSHCPTGALKLVSAEQVASTRRLAHVEKIMRPKLMEAGSGK